MSILDDGDDDFLLFDEIDEEVANAVRTNVLVTGAPPPKLEMLNQLEGAYRARGFPPVMFVETDDNGNEVFGNALEFAKLMKLPPDVLPTMDQADAWIASQDWANWEWEI